MTLRDKACLLILLLFAAGCSHKPSASEMAEPSAPAISRQYRDGPLTVVLSASETNITTAGRIKLTLDVQTPGNVGVVLPEIENLFDPFTLADSYEEQPRTLRNMKVLHRWVFLLDPGLPGHYALPPLEIAAGASFVRTDPLCVTVNSVLPADLEELKIKDIYPLVTLLPQQRRMRHYVFIGLGLFLLIAAAAIAIRVRRRILTVPPIPPHEAALQALGNLPPDAIARIHELNRILREYIENRFGLPMLGKTTPEILSLIKDSVLADHADELASFFENSETFRFSHTVPEGFVDSQTAFVRAFIEQTKEAEEEPCV